MGAKSDGGITPMGNDNGPEALRERLDKLENRLAHRNTWTAVFLVLSGFVVGAISSCTRTTSDTIEARKIILKDPSGHTLAVLGVDNNWGGLEAKNYYPGIEFRDEKGERTMSLFGTGLSVRYGDEHAQLSFTGLDIRDKETQILLNPRLFSFAAKQGAVTLTPHPTGMNLTIQSASDNEFGVVTDAESASLYVASPKWEADVSADKAGTHNVHGPKPKSD
ncbi:MAG TPA: hypothetical protein VOA64_02630 [Candidatus Dormibacteraeota bacterium]|nr:hypothetical protein [Candidatus Dormibacteraeota bacterium]